VNDFKPGLEGVVAFETEIAEPDKEGGALRYRGVDIEELVGEVPYEQVWGLLVDDSFEPGMPRAEDIELPARTGSAMADLQASTAELGGLWGLGQLIDISDEQARDDLARLSAGMISLVAQSARGENRVPDDVVASGDTAAERFLLRWRGEADPRHVRAIDSYWVSAAEHGANASTFTGRIVASTGADCGAAMSAAVGSLSGPLHGGAPTRVLKMLDEVAQTDDVDQYVRDLLDRGERIMGFGHRVYRAEDPRARVLRRTAHELEAPRVDVAEALEQAALDERRVLVGGRARHRRHPALALPGALCLRPCRWLVGSHPRAEADRTPDPAVGEVHRPRHSLAGICVTLAEAAAQAAEITDERELAKLRSEVAEEVESSARSGDYRERAIAYRAIGQLRFNQKTELLRRGLEDQSPACRGSALLSLELLSRDHPGLVNSSRGLLHALANGDPNQAVRRLAVLCLRNGSPTADTITLLAHLGEESDEKDLRAAATAVHQSLKKKSASR
jgi:citrate synthase